MLTDKELAGLVQAARLYYEDGLTQAQVAAKIGVSRPQVSKMLAHAREAGIVHIEIRPPVAGDAELLKLLQQRFGIKGGIVLPHAQREALLRETSVRYIGRLAFPIFCFLAVEGFLHTHDVKKYVRRLLLFGLLSEVPFDLAFFRTPFAPQHQNVYWTLALGVLAMAGLKRFEKENGLPGWQGLVWAGGCAALALAANTDYHAIGVLIICTLYLTRADRKRQCLAGALLFLFELTAPLAFVLVWFYNGQRGACSPLQKKAFYWFYPVHLLVLAGITNLML